MNDYKKEICRILQHEMDLDDDAILLYKRNRKIPNTDALQVIVGYNASTIFGNVNTYTEDAADGSIIEKQEVSSLEELSIVIQSANDEADDRKYEVLMALQSQFSQQIQEKNQFRIFRIPSYFADLSRNEGARLYNRFDILIRVHALYVKRSKSKAPYDYFDNFENRAYSEDTIGPIRVSGSVVNTNTINSKTNANIIEVKASINDVYTANAVSRKISTAALAVNNTNIFNLKSQKTSNAQASVSNINPTNMESQKISMAEAAINNVNTVNTKYSEPTWQVIPWAFEFDVGINETVIDSCSHGSYLHMLTDSSASVRYWDGATVTEAENNLVTTGVCIESFPNTIRWDTGKDSICYGGYKTSSNPIRRSYDNGENYATSLFMGDDYCRDLKEQQTGGIYYIYAVTSTDNKLRRRHALEGSSWETVALQIDEPNDFYHIEPFDNQLYFARSDGSIYKFNDVDDYVYVGRPNTAGINFLANYNDEKLYIGYDDGEVHIYDKSSFSLITTLAQIPFDGKYYGNRVFVAADNGHVYEIDPETDTVEADNDLGSDTKSLALHDGFIFTFPQVGGVYKAYSKKLYLA